MKESDPLLGATDEKNEDEPPKVVVYFTGLLCAGIMANFTVIMPLTLYWEGGLLSAAGLISSYAVGALVSLTFWSQYKNRIKPAYLTQALLMFVGNILYGFTVMSSERQLYVWFSRFFIGLEGGAMFNANVAFVSLSSPENRVKYLSLYQSFVGFGLVVGPAISATASAAMQDRSDTLKIGLAAIMMAGWGFCLLVALILFMPNDSELERRPAAETPEPPSFFHDEEQEDDNYELQRDRHLVYFLADLATSVASSNALPGKSVLCYCWRSTLTGAASLRGML